MNIIQFLEPILFILSLNIVKMWRVYVLIWFFIFERYYVLIRIWQIIDEFNLSSIIRIRINVKQSLKTKILLINFLYWDCLINSLWRFNWYLYQKMDYIFHWFWVEFENWSKRKWFLNRFGIEFSVRIKIKVPFKPKSFQLKVTSLELQYWDRIVIFINFFFT